ncbi:hypothetical protein BLNAU_13881 [Blattamonas nauphoetae]|uniref:Uncharacterized protein n=1 Tax=Blattamonas nauphoetae TaxID=2049346 RepID=A0ABQ9XF94_9EUKA|nr:hypothetical protein BLNAU_13881 [Blattamonas nauphoetae]
MWNLDTASVLALVKLYAVEQVTQNDSSGQQQESKHEALIFSTDYHFPSLPYYLDLLMTHMNCSPFCFVLALLYINKLHNEGTVQFVSSTAHTLIITATVIATKYLDDHFFFNNHYAHLVGIPCTDFNLMERSFLSLLQYTVFIKPSRCESFFTTIRDSVNPPSPDSTFSVYCNQYSPTQNNLPQNANSLPSLDSTNSNKSNINPKFLSSSLNIHSKAFIPASRRIAEENKRQKLAEQRERFLMGSEDFNAIVAPLLTYSDSAVSYPHYVGSESQLFEEYFQQFTVSQSNIYSSSHYSQQAFQMSPQDFPNISPDATSIHSDSAHFTNSLYFRANSSNGPPKSRSAATSQPYSVSHLQTNETRLKHESTLASAIPSSSNSVTSGDDSPIVFSAGRPSQSPPDSSEHRHRTTQWRNPHARDPPILKPASSIPHSGSGPITITARPPKSAAIFIQPPTPKLCPLLVTPPQISLQWGKNVPQTTNFVASIDPSGAIVFHTVPEKQNQIPSENTPTEKRLKTVWYARNADSTHQLSPNDGKSDEEKVNPNRFPFEIHTPLHERKEDDSFESDEPFYPAKSAQTESFDIGFIQEEPRVPQHYQTTYNGQSSHVKEEFQRREVGTEENMNHFKEEARGERIQEEPNRQTFARTFPRQIPLKKVYIPQRSVSINRQIEVRVASEAAEREREQEEKRKQEEMKREEQKREEERRIEEERKEQERLKKEEEQRKEEERREREWMELRKREEAKEETRKKTWREKVEERTKGTDSTPSSSLIPLLSGLLSASARHQQRSSTSATPSPSPVGHPSSSPRQSPSSAPLLVSPHSPLLAQSPSDIIIPSSSPTQSLSSPLLHSQPTRSLLGLPPTTPSPLIHTPPHASPLLPTSASLTHSSSALLSHPTARYPPSSSQRRNNFSHSQPSYHSSSRSAHNHNSYHPTSSNNYAHQRHNDVTARPVSRSHPSSSSSPLIPNPTSLGRNRSSASPLLPSSSFSSQPRQKNYGPHVTSQSNNSALLALPARQMRQPQRNTAISSTTYH